MVFSKYQKNTLNWEMVWAPYDLPTYQYVLSQLKPDDVVLDIGAGDLRLAINMAERCERVIAIEIQKELIINTVAAFRGLPKNLEILIADARLIPFPDYVSAGVLLMRHCQNFQLYANKLKAIGALKLFTNSRWGMAVESINLQTDRIPFSAFELGWYACWCGQTGFKLGLPEKLTLEVDEVIYEVSNCPNCPRNFSIDYKKNFLLI